MGGGLAFLTKKSFNPANISNQKNVWEAQQRKKNEAAKTRERELQIQRERDHEELERARGGDGQGDRAALRFMYDVPPGMDKKTKENDNNANTNEDDTESINEPNDTLKKADFVCRQEGDDDAAATFRQMFSASSAAMSSEQPPEDGSTMMKDNYGTSVVLSGSTMEVDPTKNAVDSRTQLEKAAGIRSRLGNTLEEQVARFPQLKNAPMAKGLKTSDVNVKFNPLGAQIRNVRCLKCGVWGHSRGERECKLSGWNPFDSYGPPPTTALSSKHPSHPTTSNQKKQLDNQRQSSDNYNSEDSRSSDIEHSHRMRKHSRKKRHRKHESKHRKNHKKKTKRKYYSSTDEYDSSASSDDSYYKRRKKSHKYEKRSKDDRK